MAEEAKDGKKRVKVPMCFSRYLLVVNEYVRAIDVDVGSFLVAFVESPALTAENFSELWHERKLATIYANIGFATDAVEFAERLLSVTKKYFMPPKDMRTRTAAVFLLRAFFITQPVARGAHVVLTSGKELRALEKHVKWMMQNGMEDGLLLLGSLARMGGFAYSLEPYPREPEHYKEYLLEAGDKVVEESSPEEIAEEKKAADELEEALKDFTALSEKYANVTKLIVERLGPERAQAVFPEGMGKIGLPVLGDEDEDEDEEENGRGRKRVEHEDSIGERRARLRARAFGLPTNL